MNETKSKYYELDKIKPYRLIAIDNAVQEFKRVFGIKTPPIDCVQLVLKMKCENKLNIRVKSTLDLPRNVLGRTMYIREANLYLVFINRNQLYDPVKRRAKYPFLYSSDRMVNFTLAHEFGHIFLGHADIPDCLKTPELREEEHLEANEFAGRALMPKSSIENCNFSSISAVAAQYIVSEQALLKRLTHLECHDKKYSVPFDVCQNCRNPNIDENYNFCPVCGVPLIDKSGVLTMHYTDGYKIDNKGRAKPCPRCGNSKYYDEDEHCRICGMILYNRCTDDYCGVYNIEDGNARYCYSCGSQTTFLRNGIINDWQPSKEAILSILETEEEICGIGNKPQDISEDWGYMLYRLSEVRSCYLSEILEGSDAKYSDNKLLIYVRQAEIKKPFERAGYQQMLTEAVQEYLSIQVDEIHIIAYNEHLPVPKPIGDDDLPF